ncbi:Tetratricopeptide repeat-containing protein [Pseudoxanthomonas sp. GM95]|uniref:tetratricopeptide repeat protein n=1 Tax=Pseudoxanthomonas sp. GM95 TaxID=1881043 RepID=UPI0008B1CA7B|nr:tetratricopeptide repeat protein [Pseudoxanthomonas sp. GM95]SEK79158.1 Tetratricopeptide repeat-containing protein [Pseudoxanthomonas sp. GM95]
MEPTQPLLDALHGITWLLVFISACGLVLSVCFVILVVNVVSVMKENRNSRRGDLKEVELEDLLASGQSKAAKFAATEWISLEPRRPEAHWALAKAHYQLGELAEAKQVLNGLMKIAPEEDYRVDAWLELVETEFTERRPKPVN